MIGALIKLIGSQISKGKSAACLAGLLKFFMKISGIRKSVALENMKIAFKDISEQQLSDIFDECCSSLMWTVTECLVLYKDPKQSLDWVVDVSGKEYLDAALAQKKGLVLATSHMGNWELAAAWFCQMGYPTYAIVRPPDDPAEADYIADFRSAMGLKTISKDEPMTKVVSILKKGGFVGILSDQHGGPVGLKAPLWGRMTSTSKGPAVFSYLTKLPLLFVSIHRIEPFKHRIIITPIEIPAGAARDEAISEVTALINKELEERVKISPAQWLWQHRRYRPQMDERL